MADKITFAYAVGLIMTSLLAIYFYFRLRKQRRTLNIEAVVYTLAIVLGGIAFYLVFFKLKR